MTTEKTPDRSSTASRRWPLWLGAGALAAILLALPIGWMAYRYIPSWYQPAYVPYEEEQEARDRLGASFTALSRGMGQGRPFEFRVRQDDLNRWLVARDRIWPASKRWIPEQIRNPMVLFREDEITLAGMWTGPGPDTVVSIRLHAEIVDGKLCVRILSVRGGALPVPVSLIRREVARQERRWRQRDEPLLPDGTSLADAIAGAPLPPEVRWRQPRGTFRIEALRIQEDELWVQLRPEPVRSRREKNDRR